MAWRPDYITVVALKAYKTIGDTVDDAELATAITAASRAIDRECNRQFGNTSGAQERFYPATYSGSRCRWKVAIDDLQTAAGLVVKVGATTVTDYTLEPRNAVADGLAFTRLIFGPNAEAVPSAADGFLVSVTANPWGWTAFPTAVVQACKIQSDRLANRRNSPYGVAGSPDLGNELRLLAKVDPDVAVSLALYVRARAVG
jgi:hypothetical protein